MVYKSKDWGLHSSIQLPIMAQVSPSEDEFDGEFDIDIEKTTKSPSTSLSTPPHWSCAHLPVSVLPQAARVRLTPT